MSTLTFDHMGVAVADIEKSVETYRALFGYKVLSGPFDDPVQQARVVFLGTGKPGDFVVELIAPLNEQSHVARHVAKGAGAYHVCYQVQDIEKALAEFRGLGCMIVSNPVPAVAYEGRKIAWLFTPARQLMELVEAAPTAALSAEPTHTRPDTSQLRQQADEAVKAGDAAIARGLLARLWHADPGAATAGFVSTRFEKIKASCGAVACRVAFLRSFTIEPAVAMLRAAAAASNVDAPVWVGDFNTYQQEALDAGSGLYKFDPGVIVLAVHARDITPDIWERGADMRPAELAKARERVVNVYRGVLEAIRAKTKAHVIVHNLEIPEAPAPGVFDAQDSAGQAQTLRAINAELVSLARQHSGVYVLDYDGLVSRHGKRAWHDERKWQTMRMPIAADCLVHLAREWNKYLHPITGRVAKCLVLDCDNTLWGGVIGEDGMHGIRIGIEHPGSDFRNFQRAILDLASRGVILAVCSKNNHADALEVFEKHDGMLLRPEHIACFRVNWKDKASNLREIAAELNIGIDSLAFFDDNPAEREIVRRHAPEVMVLEVPADPASYARALREWPVFERLSLSAEDRERGKFYAQDRQRAELEQSTGSLEDFYRSLEQEAQIGEVTPATLARVAQLTQKTNQFNMTTKRYTEAEIAALAKDKDWLIRWIRVRDRFGDNGIIGVVMGRLAGEGLFEIDNFLLSCRVIGRTVETAILANVLGHARAMGASRVGGYFLPTKKNAPAKDFYRQHNFTLVSETSGNQRWEMDLATSTVDAPPWVKLDLSSAAPAEAHA